MIFRRPSNHYGISPVPVTPHQRAAQVWDDRIGAARVQAQKAQWKKQLIAGAFVPVIWVLTIILCNVLGVENGLFISPAAIIGALLSLPFLLYACGVFQQQTQLERFGKIVIALVIIMFGLFAMDFVCRLIFDFQITHR